MGGGVRGTPFLSGTLALPPPKYSRGCECLRTGRLQGGGSLGWGPPLPRPGPFIPAVRNSKSPGPVRGERGVESRILLRGLSQGQR